MCVRVARWLRVLVWCALCVLCWLLLAACGLGVCWLFVACCIGGCLLVVGWYLLFGCLLLVVCWFVACCLRFAFRGSLFVVHVLLLTA